MSRRLIFDDGRLTSTSHIISSAERPALPSQATREKASKSRAGKPYTKNARIGVRHRLAAQGNGATPAKRLLLVVKALFVLLSLPSDHASEIPRLPHPFTDLLGGVASVYLQVGRLDYITGGRPKHRPMLNISLHRCLALLLSCIPPDPRPKLAVVAPRTMATNAGKVMLPLQSLLNPTPRDSSLAPTSQPCITANRSSDIPPASYAKMQHSPSSSSFSVKGAFRPQPSQGRETSSILIKTKPRGPINYPPYEDLDEDALQLVQHFQVEPFGTINRGFQHIPYTSSKKDLFEKTGRESIEGATPSPPCGTQWRLTDVATAFKYEFRVPGHERAYVVMWDYNIGIVRMNPFIKWGGYPKVRGSRCSSLGSDSVIDKVLPDTRQESRIKRHITGRHRGCGICSR